MLNHTIKLEICAGSLSDVITASSSPAADRIELNCALELGGLTPSLETLRMAREHTSIPIVCMVRPRPAGFVYSQTEKETMYRDAKTFLENGADGIVFGCLNADHTIDTEYTQKMAALIHSYGREAVFHKAFDAAADADVAAKALIACGIDRILTSGMKPDVFQGIDMIAYLQKTYGSDIQILPGGGVTKENIRQVLSRTGCTQIHMTAKTLCHDDTGYYAVGADRIREIAALFAKPLRQRVLTREDAEMFDNDSYEASMRPFTDDDERRD